MSFWTKKLTFRDNPGAAEGINQGQFGLQTAQNWKDLAPGTQGILRDLLHGNADKVGLIQHIAGEGAKLNAAYDSEGSYSPEMPADVQNRITEETHNKNNTAAAQMAVDSATGLGQGLLGMKEAGRQAKLQAILGQSNLLAQLMANRYQGSMEGGEGTGLLGALISGGAQAAGAYYGAHHG